MILILIVLLGLALKAAPEITSEISGLGKRKCSGGDLNPHALRHTPLKRTCLPFHHPSVGEANRDGRSKMAARKYSSFVIVLPLVIGQSVAAGDQGESL